MGATDRTLAPEDVAAQLGVSAKTVRKWARAGHIAHVKFPGRYRFAQADVDAYLQRVSVPAQQ